ncbi:MAG: T9SS type A sorting domain-containing protein [Ignavibacteria bacterium]|nr:T9SS type A sorting domain-containing protein [Ignavibacteria bacterium]
MKTTKHSLLRAFCIVLFLLFLSYTSVYSNPNGISGRTKKTMSAGCGSCHVFGTGITGIIEGPDSVITGQTVIFTLTMNFPGNANGGVDIAARFGILAPGSSSGILKLLNGELTHKNPIVFTTSISIPFNYTAPAVPGTDTLYANIDRNYTGTWNYVDNKRIRVCSSIGIINNETPVSYYLSQNFPNPFNPVTRINFGVIRHSHVKILVYNMLGEKISVLADSEMDNGNYFVLFDASNFASGVYFYRFEVSNGNGHFYSEVKRMTVLK